LNSFLLCLLTLFPSASLTYWPVHLTQGPCFPPCRALWALKPDFQCGWEKKCEFVLFFFRAQYFSFFSHFHAHFGFALASAKARKKTVAPTSVIKYIYLNTYRYMYMYIYIYTHIHMRPHI
jgi:hypothetical protein